MSGQLPREFRTQRLLLRPFRTGDAGHVYAYASDPEWAQYLPDMPNPYRHADAADFVAERLQDAWAKQAVFAMVLHDRVVGAIDFRIAETNWANLGYSLAREHWGKGLVAEAARPLITAAFQIGLARIEISTALPNHRSWRIAEKLGFTYEGTLRSRMQVREQRYDAVYYGLLPDEWKG